MSIFKLILKNIEGNSFRSWMAFGGALLMAALVTGAGLLIGGAQDSLNNARQRLGADLIVTPAGNEGRMENAFLMGVPATMWMPDSVVQAVAQMPGVAQVSPQIFLSTLRGATCCSVPEMFMVGFDPATDFTLRPWLEEDHLQAELSPGEAIGGGFVYSPEDNGKILVYGYEMHLKGNLEMTGTGLDQTLFFTFDTARQVATASTFKAQTRLNIPLHAVSSVLVRLEPGADAHALAAQIDSQLLGVETVVSTNLFQTQRSRLSGLGRSSIALLSVAWLLALGLISVIFSVATHARRREIAMLRALGAPRQTVVNTLLGEALLLALLGSAAGVGLALFCSALFRNLLIQWMGVPFLTPSWLDMLALALQGLAAAVLTVLPAALLPTLRFTAVEPALAMKE